MIYMTSHINYDVNCVVHISTSTGIYIFVVYRWYNIGNLICWCCEIVCIKLESFLLAGYFDLEKVSYIVCNVSTEMIYSS